VLPNEVFTDWVTQPGPGAVIHVEGSTRPYDDRLSPNLCADPEVRDLIQHADRCFLYELDDQFSHAEVLFVCEHGSSRSPQPLTGRQVKTVLGLLRVLSALVHGFEEPVGDAPAEMPPTRDSAILRFYNERMQRHRLASLARQLAHLPDHLIGVSPGWAGAVIAVPNAEPLTMDDASQLNIVECSLNYSDLINRRMSFPTTERHSLSARAYREQQTRVEWQPSPENSLLYADEEATVAMAIPLGLGPYIGAKGSLFVFARGTRAENVALVRDTQPALEVLAHIVGQIIEAHLHQGWLFQECHLIVMDEGQRDRLTRWQSATAFAEAVQATGDLGMPVILVHLLYPEIASAEMLAIALRLIDDLLREEALLRRLRSLLKTPPGTPAEMLYTGYVLDRSTQAIVVNPALRYDDETFYAVKTALAKALRSVRFDGRPDRPNFAWVRAAITHGAACQDCHSLGMIACVLPEQRQLFECVQGLHAAIAARRYGDASDYLDRLQATSPTSRLPNWSCQDPALSFERGRVSAMEAATMRDLAGLERAVEQFARIPRSCWTGSALREWAFTLKTLAEWRLWNGLTARAGPGDAWERESAEVMSLCTQARDLLEGGCSIQETPPTRGTVREMMRMLQDIEMIEDRARALDASWRA
jgi:hypothetical protein